MGIWEDAFAHGSGEEGEVGAVNHVCYSAFRLSIGSAFADNDQGSFGGFEHLRDFKEFGFFGCAFWALWYWEYILDLSGIFNDALDNIRREIDEARAWPAVP